LNSASKGSNLQAGGEHHFHVAPQGETQVFDRLSIERINQGDPDGVVRLADRQSPMQTRQPSRNEMEDLRAEFHLVEVDHLAPKRVGDRLVKLRFVDNSVIDHRPVDGFPVLRRLEQDVIGLGPVHQALVDKKIGESFVIHSLGSQTGRLTSGYLRLPFSFN
jgi:hypothetical protein